MDPLHFVLVLGLFWQHWAAVGCGARDMVQELERKGEASQGGVKEVIREDNRLLRTGRW